MSGLSIATIGELYSERSGDLERILGRAVDAPASVVEEACQRAWAQLLVHRDEVDHERAVSWLATTARREVIQQLREAGEAAVLEDAIHLGTHREPAHVVELRDRIARLGGLSERQRRLVWLRGLGYGTAEISARTGDSIRTVERQIMRARRRLREAETGAAA